MGFWKSIKFWLKDTFQSRGRSVKQSSSLRRTISDATHVRGGRQSSGFSSSEEVIQQALEGHENYQRSFKKNS